VSLKYAAIGLAAFAFSAVAAQAAPAKTELNRLDCHLGGVSGADLVCPGGKATEAAESAPLQTGRASVEGALSPAKTPTAGSPEWTSQCAAKYKSFNPETGKYRSFSGEQRPCQL
jgi:hypothetical protein